MGTDDIVTLLPAGFQIEDRIITARFASVDGLSVTPWFSKLDPVNE